MEPNRTTKSAFRVIPGGKANPTRPVAGLRSNETPDRPQKPLSREEIEQLRLMVDRE